MLEEFTKDEDWIDHYVPAKNDYQGQYFRYMMLPTPTLHTDVINKVRTFISLV
jgi:hypothetical protein